jgi:hypothetical protein
MVTSVPLSVRHVPWAGDISDDSGTPSAIAGATKLVIVASNRPASTGAVRRTAWEIALINTG